MDEKTQKALEASIKKWEANAEAEAANFYHVSSKRCPLCKLFNRDDQVTARCTDCPVWERTGRRFCRETPYKAAFEARNKWANSIYGSYAEQEVAKAHAQEMARNEVEFLKSLREVRT